MEPFSHSLRECQQRSRAAAIPDKTIGGGLLHILRQMGRGHEAKKEKSERATKMLVTSVGHLTLAVVHSVATNQRMKGMIELL